MSGVNADDYDEPFGTTAIPTSCSPDKGSSRPTSVRFDVSALEQKLFNGSVAQQPQTQAIAVYEASKNDDDEYLIRLNGSLIDVNSQFVIYTVKNGLIRVMHRHSAMRALLRGHANQVVTDIKFFHDGDVVGKIGRAHV